MPVAIIRDENETGAVVEGPFSDADEHATRNRTAGPQQGYGARGVLMPLCTDPIALQQEREREGRCANCGLQTHEIHTDPLTSAQVKVPLTIEHEVHRGRCLLCYPIFTKLFLEGLQKNQPSCYHSLHSVPSVPVIVSTSCASQRSPDCASLLNSPSRARLTSRPSPTRRVSQLWTPSSTYDVSAHSPPLPIYSKENNYPMSNVSSSTIAYTYHDPSDSFVQSSLTILHHASGCDLVDILAAMKRVPHDLVVQERGCERLWILSWEEEFASALGRVGGIPVVLDAMARFPWAAHLQQCATECLQNLAACSFDDFNRREICELSGVPLIVQAMMRHSSVAGIQQCGCNALANIAIGNCGATGCMPMNDSSLRSTNSSLENPSSIMSTNDDDFRDVIKDAGGLTPILLAAQNFSDEESVLQAAYDALQAMGYDHIESPPVSWSNSMVIHQDDNVSMAM